MSTRGSLIKILGDLPGEMVFRDGLQTWRVDALLESLESVTAKRDQHAYVLYKCTDGRFAIVVVDSMGSLSHTASFMQVR